MNSDEILNNGSKTLLKHKINEVLYFLFGQKSGF